MRASLLASYCPRWHPLAAPAAVKDPRWTGRHTAPEVGHTQGTRLLLTFKLNRSHAAYTPQRGAHRPTGFRRAGRAAARQSPANAGAVFIAHVLHIDASRALPRIKSNRTASDGQLRMTANQGRARKASRATTTSDDTIRDRPPSPAREDLQSARTATSGHIDVARCERPKTFVVCRQKPAQTLNREGTTDGTSNGTTDGTSNGTGTHQPPRSCWRAAWTATLTRTGRVDAPRSDYTRSGDGGSARQR